MYDTKMFNQDFSGCSLPCRPPCSFLTPQKVDVHCREPFPPKKSLQQGVSSRYCSRANDQILPAVEDSLGGTGPRVDDVSVRHMPSTGGSNPA
jgi:hypothetical protein